MVCRNNVNLLTSRKHSSGVQCSGHVDKSLPVELVSVIDKRDMFPLFSPTTCFKLSLPFLFLPPETSLRRRVFRKRSIPMFNIFVYGLYLVICPKIYTYTHN